MHKRSKKRGFGMLELVVVIIIIVILLAMLIPAIQKVREDANRAGCCNRMQQIGLASQNYQSATGRLPASSTLCWSKTSGNKKGWGFLVMVLPYMDYNSLYKNLSFTSTGDPTDGSAGSLAANTTQIREFVCPINPNSKNNGAKLALCFTNYKGMGATHMQSLNHVLGKGTPMYPPKGPYDMHPDGAMYPGKGNRLSDLIDGTSHTILCVETIDDQASVWTYGSDATLVGLPTIGNGAANPGAARSPALPIRRIHIITLPAITASSTARPRHRCRHIAHIWPSTSRPKGPTPGLIRPSVPAAQTASSRPMALPRAMRTLSIT